MDEIKISMGSKDNINKVIVIKYNEGYTLSRDVEVVNKGGVIQSIYGHFIPIPEALKHLSIEQLKEKEKIFEKKVTMLKYHYEDEPSVLNKTLFEEKTKDYKIIELLLNVRENIL